MFKSMFVMKSVMTSNKMSYSSFTVTQLALYRVAHIERAYELYLRKQNEEEEAMKKKATQVNLFRKFEEQRKKNSKLNDLETWLKDKEKRISDTIKGKGKSGKRASRGFAIIVRRRQAAQSFT